MKKQYKLIGIDLQNDFAEREGLFFVHGIATTFIKTNIFPFLDSKNIKINEIISDYRQPRPGDRGDCCHPGEWGYESIIPRNIVNSVWIKCMNSPIWVRDGIGQADMKAGLPYQDTEGFADWLKENVGDHNLVTPVLFGLTVDCCVLSTAQELSWRGYSPLVIKEGVAHANGKSTDRDKILETPLPNWANVISWEELKKELQD